MTAVSEPTARRSSAPSSPSTAARATPASSASSPSRPSSHKAELVAVHVVEIDWTLPLDADIASRSEEVQRVLDIAEAIAEESEVSARAGPAPGTRRRARPSSTRPSEREADLLVLGLPYRKRFGGDFAIGRTIPYVLQNAPCAVWVVREPIAPRSHA